MLLFQLLNLHQRFGQVTAKSVVVKHNKIFNSTPLLFNERFPRLVNWTIKSIATFAIINVDRSKLYLIMFTILTYGFFLIFK
nr:hypothetical protein [Sphingobacterium sp.]